MKRILSLVVLLLVSYVGFAQAPSNYTNINGRYRWIAGMFDSTFSLPKGTTPSLRTGGSTNPGALFYRTTDSTVKYWTGSQWLTLSDTTRYVPYTGATKNVNLGQYGMTTKWLQFDTSSQAVTDRRLQWSNDDGTLQFGMTNGSTITQRIGLEQFARVKNVDATQINKGDVVYLFGASGDRAAVKKADNRSDATSSKTLGVAAEDIPVNEVGLIGTFGVVGNLNLAAYNPGDILYLDSIPGKMTATKPQAPYHLVFIGVVERANAGNGLLFTNVQNGYELEELHNVRITSPVNNKAILAYDSVRALWVDTTLNAIGGVSGSGIINSVTKWTGSTSIGNSAIYENGGVAFIGNGEIAYSPSIGVISGTGGFGTNVAGAEFRIRGGASTGSADGGPITFYTSVAGGSGTNIRIASEKMRLSPAGSLGIGTISPDSMLTVTQGTYLQRGVRLSGLPAAPGTKALRIDASGTISTADTLIDAGGTVTSVATNNGTGITGGTITTTGTLAIDTLLISTRAWRQKGVDSLQANINGKLNISDTATMLANYITGPQTFSGYMARFNGGGTIDTSRIFQNNGLVGVNTTSPFYSLDVTGTGRITSNTYLATTSGVVGIGTTSADSLLTVQEGAWLKRGLRLSGLPAASGTKSLRIDASGTISYADTLTNGVSGTGTTNYIPKFTGTSSIGNSAIYDNSGNIGINRTDASYKLDIYNVGGSSAAARLYGNDQANVRLRLENSGGRTWELTGGLTGADNSAFTIYDVTAAATRMAIDASGNLGLGTSTIYGKFHINSNGAPASSGTMATGLTISNGTSGTAINIGTNDGGGYNYIQSSYVNNADVARPLTFFTGATEKMRLDASGNLGLGVTPSAWGFGGNLEFQDGRILMSSGQYLYMTQNAFYNGTNWIYKTTNPAARYSQEIGSHIWYNAPSGSANGTISFTQAMTLDASGNLLVGGTSSSGERLQVTGTGKFSANLSAIFNSNSNTPYIRFDQSNSAKFFIGERSIVSGSGGTGYDFYSASGNDIQFFTNGSSTSRLAINTAGNVGIGTTSPNSTLHTNGSFSTNYVSKTATYTLTGSDYTVYFDAVGAAANLTANLPDATTCKGRIYTIIANVNATYNVTLDGNGTQTIGGTTTLGMWDGCNQKATIVIQSDGSNWQIISFYAYENDC